jgi:hypothetical protein
LSVVMLSVVMLSVVMLSVVAPLQLSVSPSVTSSNAYIFYRPKNFQLCLSSVGKLGNNRQEFIKHVNMSKR